MTNPEQLNHIYDYSKGSTNTYVISVRHGLPQCIICGDYSVITLDGNQYYSYFIKGEYLQNAFPNLTPAERDHVKLGIHPACQEIMYGDESDD